MCVNVQHEIDKKVQFLDNINVFLRDGHLFQ